VTDAWLKALTVKKRIVAAMRLRYKAVKSRYWRPEDDYVTLILNALGKLVRDGDIVVVSEKAVATAKGNIIDEGSVKPGLLAYLLSRFWMRFFWGYLFGRLCRFRKETLERLRNYPIEEGSRHKQVVLDNAGFVQALTYGSEGGIDISNLPYSYACLPLENPEEETQHIRDQISKHVGKKVTIIIADTDSTFSFRGVHFTTRSNAIEGIKSFKGPIPFIFGRMLRLEQRATPLAVAGSEISVEDALRFSEVAHHARGYGGGRTVWDVAQKLGVGVSEISWEMLERVNHYPIVLIRRTTD